jgi:hypothetical protein
MIKKIEKLFWGPADPRAYALVRMALALGCLVNLIDLWPYRQAFFSDLGMIPLESVQPETRGEWYLSVFYSLQSPAAVTAVFVVAAIAILMFGAGFMSRFAASAVLVFQMSYCNRAFAALHSWDSILRIYALLAFVSPLGRAWSVDGWLSPRETDKDDVPAYGLRLMQWQLLIIYTITVWLKVPDQYWRNGQLLAYFSVSFYSRTPDSLMLVNHEWLSALQTWLSLLIEATVCLMLFARRTRWLGFLAGFALHGGIALTSRIEVFSFSMIAPYFAFLERHDVDRLVAVVRGLRGRVFRNSAPPAALTAGQPGSTGG